MQGLPNLDRFDLYELCVQGVATLGPMLVAAHGGLEDRVEARVLHEDFAGSAALSRWWAARGEGWRALATELDPATARAAEDRAAAAHAEMERVAGSHGAARVSVRVGDVMDLSVEIAGRADVVFVGNFSVGYLGTRVELMRYLRGALDRLKPGGVLAVDLYGGASAFKLGGTVRRVELGEGRAVQVLWRHDAADARTARVVNSLSFRVLEGGEVTQDLPEAFVYRWRLWGLAELREAMTEAGFESTRVLVRLRDGMEGATAQDDPLGDDWVALVVARRA